MLKNCSGKKTVKFKPRPLLDPRNSVCPSKYTQSQRHKTNLFVPQTPSGSLTHDNPHGGFLSTRRTTAHDAQKGTDLLDIFGYD